MDEDENLIREFINDSSDEDNDHDDLEGFIDNDDEFEISHEDMSAAMRTLNEALDEEANSERES